MDAKRKLSAEEARQFDGYSVANAARVAEALPCGCEPYVDVFTYNRWRAQGFQVQKGEHGVKLPVIVRVEREDGETHEVKRFGMRRSSAVFCRHQVKPIGSDKEAVAA